jgi:hypothetical protein
LLIQKLITPSLKLDLSGGASMKSHNIQLTSAEIGSLWSSYMMESAILPVLKYFTHTVGDSEGFGNFEYSFNFFRKPY